MVKLSNVDVCYWLNDWCKEAHVSSTETTFKVDHKKRIIYIFTARPGYLIGKAGSVYGKYKKLLQDAIDKHNRIRKKANAEKKFSPKLEMMKPYKIELVEVTEASFWVDYDPMGEGF